MSTIFIFFWYELRLLQIFKQYFNIIWPNMVVLCGRLEKYPDSLFGRVLWHVNPTRLFNTKSCSYIHIIYMLCKQIVSR